MATAKKITKTAAKPATKTTVQKTARVDHKLAAEKLQRELDSTLVSNSFLNKEKTELAKEKLELQESNTRLKEDLDKVLTEQQESDVRIVQLRRDLADSEARAKALSNQMTRANTDLQAYREAAYNAEHALEELRSQYVACNEDYKSADARADTLWAKLNNVPRWIRSMFDAV